MGLNYSSVLRSPLLKGYPTSTEFMDLTSYTNYLESRPLFTKNPETNKMIPKRGRITSSR
ncbi:hypothetical protein YDYSY3_47510 [Paenibacillus chitinolyticus]|nr:hypothetical protein YDYSY3_47510 [Paenibacillus chitinolyticus]